MGNTFLEVFVIHILCISGLELPQHWASLQAAYHHGLFMQKRLTLWWCAWGRRRNRKWRNSTMSGTRRWRHVRKRWELWAVIGCYKLFRMIENGIIKIFFTLTVCDNLKELSCPWFSSYVMRWAAVEYSEDVNHLMLKKRHYWNLFLHILQFTKIARLSEEQVTTSLKEVENLFMKATCSPVCQNHQEAVMNCYNDHPQQSLRCAREVEQFTQCVDLSRLVSLLFCEYILIFFFVAAN